MFWTAWLVAKPTSPGRAFALPLPRMNGLLSSADTRGMRFVYRD